jgi:hypothetical protein
LKGATGDARYRVVSALPEATRFEFLPSLAAEAFMHGEFLDYHKHDTAGASAEWERCRKYAQDLVDLAPKFKDDPGYGAAILHGNIALGTVAMRLGDKTAAVRYIREAAKAPASEELAYTDDLLWSRLAIDLLRFGERESVAQFLEWYAQIRVPPQSAMLRNAAAAIRAGTMPGFYQARMMGQ